MNLYLWAGKFCRLIPESGVLGQEEKWRENISALEDSAVTLWSLFSQQGYPPGHPSQVHWYLHVAQLCITDVLHGAAGMLQMLCKRDGDCEESGLGLFLIVFSLVSTENEISAITGNSVTSLPGTSEMMTSAPFGSMSVFDPQSVGAALGLQICLFFQKFISTIGSKGIFTSRQDWRRSVTLPFGQGGRGVSVVGLCQGANCKCFSLTSSVINKASEHSSPRSFQSRLFLRRLTHLRQCLSAPAHIETELLLGWGSSCPKPVVVAFGQGHGIRRRSGV